jgi:hypothetical protein
MDSYVARAGETVLCYHGPLLYPAKVRCVPSSSET